MPCSQGRGHVENPNASGPGSVAQRELSAFLLGSKHKPLPSAHGNEQGRVFAAWTASLQTPPRRAANCCPWAGLPVRAVAEAGSLRRVHGPGDIRFSVLSSFPYYTQSRPKLFRMRRAALRTGHPRLSEVGREGPWTQHLSFSSALLFPLQNSAMNSLEK